jgi:hypothetical protein
MSNLPSAFGWIARSTSAPFLGGQCPIQPVMPARCLSAAGLRFWDPPVPTGVFGRPYGWRTDRSQIPLGVATFRTIETRLRWGPSILRGRGVPIGNIWGSPATEAGALPVMLLPPHGRLAFQSSCPATSISALSRIRAVMELFP